jgi:hypothetical protein
LVQLGTRNEGWRSARTRRYLEPSGGGDSTMKLAGLANALKRIFALGKKK